MYVQLFYQWYNLQYSTSTTDLLCAVLRVHAQFGVSINRDDSSYDLFIGTQVSRSMSVTGGITHDTCRTVTATMSIAVSTTD